MLHVLVQREFLFLRCAEGLFVGPCGPGASAPALDPPPPGALPASFLIGPLCGPGASAPLRAFLRSKNLGAGRIHFARSIFNDRAPTKATLLWDGDVPIRLPLWNPSPHRPRPGAPAPALDPAPAGRMPGTSSLFTIHFSLTDSTILLKSGARPLSHGCAVPAPPQGEPSRSKR